MASSQPIPNLTSVQVRPDHHQYRRVIRNYLQGRKSDCVLVCGKRAFNLHRSVLYSSTGLIQGILLKRSNTEPIVLDDLYSGLVEQCISLIYRGQGIVTLDQLPLFTRMIRSIQLKLGVAYHSLHNPADVPSSIFQPSTEEQENDPTPANCQVSTSRPILAPWDINLGPCEPIPPVPSISCEDLVPTLIEAPKPTVIGNRAEHAVYENVLGQQLTIMQMNSQLGVASDSKYLDYVLEDLPEII